MKQLNFVYQYHWIRIFLLLPMLLIIGYIDHLIDFLMISLTINFLVFVNYPRLSLLVAKRKGCVKVIDQSVSFTIEKKDIVFNVGDIGNIEFIKIKMFSANVGKLVISFKDNSKKKLVLYSEDFYNGEIEWNSLYIVYQSIKDLIHE